ncbi:MAG: 4Fe-4S binding protein [Bacillota bacterium]
MWPARFIAARATRMPVIGWLIKRFFFDGDYIAYLPARQKEIAKAKVVLPDMVVNHFIERAGFRFLMHQCICRESNKCKNYPASVGCLFLGEAAKGINSALGREVSVAEAKAFQKKVQELGLLNLVGRNRLDKIWLGVSPADHLMTICHCCECCCLWKIIPHLSASIGNMLQKLDGVDLNVSDSCRGCGKCVPVCFARAIEVVNSRAVIGTECRGCGRCTDACPEKAITLTLADNDFINRCIARFNGYVTID